MKKGSHQSIESRIKMSISGKKRGPNNKGFKFSPESLERLSKSHLGQIPWNKGKTGIYSEEYRNKLRLALKGKKIPNGGFKRGHIPWCKGTTDQKYIEKMRNKRLHQVFPFKDTKPERLLQQALLAESIIFEKHKPILGQPDIFIEPNICVFVDGDYWHNLPTHKKRDVFVNENLEKQGYVILRFWEHEIYEDIRNVVTLIILRIEEMK